jgi:hypothetical protein
MAEQKMATALKKYQLPPLPYAPDALEPQISRSNSPCTTTSTTRPT